MANRVSSKKVGRVTGICQPGPISHTEDSLMARVSDGVREGREDVVLLSCCLPKCATQLTTRASKLALRPLLHRCGWKFGIAKSANNGE